MLNFVYYNPVRVLFGKGTIAELAHLVPVGKKVMITYATGAMSWMKGGVYDQIMDALKHHSVIEFGDIEPNPHYETLMVGVQQARREAVDYLLAVGGGSGDERARGGAGLELPGVLAAAGPGGRSAGGGAPIESTRGGIARCSPGRPGPGRPWSRTAAGCSRTRRC